MIEAIVTFSLIGLGVLAWATAYVARRHYRQRRLNGLPPDNSSFWATVFGDGGASGGAHSGHHQHHDAGHSHGADAGHHGGDLGGGGHH